MEIFNTLVIYPLINVLVAVYDILNYINVPYALGFAIIGLTIIIRFILYPLTNAQLRASQRMQKLAPKISELKEKYKGDNKKVQEETMKLYKENGVNPAAGCLPTLVQLPILWGLYNVLNGVVHKTPEQAMAYVNSIVIEPLQLSEPWDPTFFGIPLGLSPHQMLQTLPLIAIAVPVVTGLFQFFQSKMMFPTPPASASKSGKKNDDFATVFQKQSAYLFPIMIGFFSFNFPFGLSLYWNTFSIFGIIQQYRVSGLGGLEDLWQKAKKLPEEKVKEIFAILGIEDSFEVIESDESIDIMIDSEDPGMIIGHHGDTLDSLQLMLSLLIAKDSETFKRVYLEVGDYKKNRSDYLRNLAEQTKERALSENREIFLPSLKPWERREVHMFLAEDEEVMSESVGEGKDRTLVVKPR